MIGSQMFTTKVALKTNPEDKHPGLSKLFAAAVVSQSFRDMLLRDPEQALKVGYLGDTFGLSEADAALLVSINAKSLPDLARQVVHTLEH